MSRLEESLARWTPATGAVASIGEPSRPGWTSVEQLAADARAAAEFVAAVHDAAAVVGGSFLLARAARAVAEPSMLALVDTGHAPRLAAESVSVRLNETGRVVGVAFADAEPGAGDAAAFARALEDTFGGLVEALRAEIPLGFRGLWGLVNDAVGGAAVALHRTEPSALDVATEALTLGRSTARPTWIVGDGGAALFRRGSCWLAFRIDDHGYCAGCPVRSGTAGQG